MPEPLLSEGTDLNAMLAKLQAEHGDAATVIYQDSVRRGGFGGFFTREVHRLAYLVSEPAPGDATMPSADPVSTPAFAVAEGVSGDGFVADGLAANALGSDGLGANDFASALDTALVAPYTEPTFSESTFSESTFSESKFSEPTFSESTFSESKFSELSFTEPISADYRPLEYSPLEYSPPNFGEASYSATSEEFGSSADVPALGLLADLPAVTDSFTSTLPRLYPFSDVSSTDLLHPAAQPTMPALQMPTPAVPALSVPPAAAFDLSEAADVALTYATLKPSPTSEFDADAYPLADAAPSTVAESVFDSDTPLFRDLSNDHRAATDYDVAASAAPEKPRQLASVTTMHSSTARARLEMLMQLRDVGVPVGVNPKSEAHTIYEAMQQVLAQLPPAPPMPSEPGQLLAIVGPLTPSLRTAQSLASSLRVPVADLWIAGLTGHPAAANNDPLGAERTIADPAQAKLMRSATRSSSTVSIVVVATDAIEGDPLDLWPSQILSALNPDLSLLMVDASRKLADERSRLDRIGAIDALAVYDSTLSSSPATVWDLGLPVAVLDGRPATTFAWSSLLFSALPAEERRPQSVSA